jgi:CTD kinase subunit alpha
LTSFSRFSDLIYLRLSNIGGDWHEFESKALRKENERKDREARRAQKDGAKEKEKKRTISDNSEARDAKRAHVENPAAVKGPVTADGGA